jgi:hypothetical protein
MKRIGELKGNCSNQREEAAVGIVSTWRSRCMEKEEDN